ncbi:MAG: aspartate 1-decarboxylase [Candidatus Margulisbacteria bacterium]|nr:aspartate 1-decarboxylase [Candidatus Margulisiibacteriota bacterium]
MLITICKSKIHRATVTDTNINYEGSITIDKRLMEAADIHEYEQVQVVNVTNGERFTTYVMKGEKKGAMVLNGAAARLAVPGDKIIVITYAQLKNKEVGEYKPRIVLVDEANEIIKKD